MDALRAAHQVVRKVESVGKAYAVFVCGGAVEFVPADGVRCAKLRADPLRAAHEVAVVQPGSCEAALAVRLRAAGVSLQAA